MTANTQLAPLPVFRAFDVTGIPLAGGKLYTYEAGTTTPLATYTDSTGNTANANPVILDSAGQANVWLSLQAYKFVLTDADDVPQWTVDQINAQPPKVVNVQDYGAVGDGTTNDSPAFDDAAAAAGAWGTVIVPRPSVSYKLSTNVTGPAFWILMGGATTSSIGTLGGLTIQQVSGGSIAIGAQTIYIDNAGRIGINNTAPQEVLDISGNINLSDNGTTTPFGQIIWNESVTLIDYGNTTADAMSLWTYNYGTNQPQAVLKLKQGSNCLFGECINIQGNGGGFGNSEINFLNVLTSEAPRAWKWAITSGGSNEYNDTMYLKRHGSSNVTQNTPITVWADGTGTNAGSITILGADTHTRYSGLSNSYSGRVVTIDDSSNYASIPATNLTPSVCFLNHGGSALTSVFAQTFGYLSTQNNLVVCGTISVNNSGPSVAYNTSSDYRMKNFKEFLDPAIALDKVNSVNVRRYSWRTSDSGELFDGFYAHEMQAVVPHAVTGEKDATNDEGAVLVQQLDYSKLVPILWAAIQELANKVERLENGRVY